MHAYLNAAHDRGYIAKVPKPRKGEHPTPGKREAGYFEDAELPRLFYELPEGSYRVLAATAIETGTRVGELAAEVGHGGVPDRSSAHRPTMSSGCGVEVKSPSRMGLGGMRSPLSPPPGER